MSVEKKESKSGPTVVFLDWDDTLLCSSYLFGQGLRLDTELEPTHDIFRELKDLETSVVSLLKLARQFGEVHVVTNAETGWVQLSAKKFLPGVVPLLEDVTILSARSTFETLFPDSPLKWKFCAFSRLSKAHSPATLISFGDSHVEREAVQAVGKTLKHAMTKSVKFTEKPNMEQLRKQLDLVTNCFHVIHSHEGDLDLQLTLSQNDSVDVSSPAPATVVPADAEYPTPEPSTIKCE